MQLDCTRDATEVKRRLGYSPDEPVFYDFLNGKETIDFVLNLRGMPLEPRGRRSGPIVDRLEFVESLDVAAGGFSHGTKKKLALLLAIAHDPTLLLLDEPTNGLDPPTAARVRALLRERADAGAAVVVSTHSLEMADLLCDRVLVVQSRSSHRRRNHRRRARAGRRPRHVRRSKTPSSRWFAEDAHRMLALRQTWTLAVLVLRYWARAGLPNRLRNDQGRRASGAAASRVTFLLLMVNWGYRIGVACTQRRSRRCAPPRSRGCSSVSLGLVDRVGRDGSRPGDARPAVGDDVAAARCAPALRSEPRRRSASSSVSCSTRSAWRALLAIAPSPRADRRAPRPRPPHRGSRSPATPSLRLMRTVDLAACAWRASPAVAHRPAVPVVHGDRRRARAREAPACVPGGSLGPASRRPRCSTGSSIAPSRSWWRSRRSVRWRRSASASRSASATTGSTSSRRASSIAVPPADLDLVRIEKCPRDARARRPLARARRVPLHVRRFGRAPRRVAPARRASRTKCSLVFVRSLGYVAIVSGFARGSGASHPHGGPRLRALARCSRRSPSRPSDLLAAARRARSCSRRCYVAAPYCAAPRAPRVRRRCASRSCGASVAADGSRWCSPQARSSASRSSRKASAA